VIPKLVSGGKRWRTAFPKLRHDRSESAYWRDVARSTLLEHLD
jgi:hypothetical protein